MRQELQRRPGQVHQRRCVLATAPGVEASRPARSRAWADLPSGVWSVRFLSRFFMVNRPRPIHPDAKVRIVRRNRARKEGTNVTNTDASPAIVPNFDTETPTGRKLAVIC